MTSRSNTRLFRTPRILITALVLFVAGFIAAPLAEAQDETPEKPPVVTFGNEDAADAPPINVVRDKPKPKGAVEDAEGEEGEGEEGEEGEGEEGEEGEGEGEEEEEEKIIDSFMKLDGSPRYHLASCKLVAKSLRKKQSMNGAGVIKARLVSCSVCKPPKPVKNPPKKEEGKEGEAKKPEGEAQANEESNRGGRSLAPRPRPEPEPQENNEGGDGGAETGAKDER